METTPRSDLHLWEVEHSYYCSEGNYYQTGCHDRYESWAEFAQPAKLTASGNDGNLLYDFDDDLNLLWRWDWIKARRDDYFTDDSPIYPGAAEEFEEASQTDTLQLFFMFQRKARNGSAEVIVTEADEPAIREWLAGKAAHMRRLWEPFA